METWAWFKTRGFKVTGDLAADSRLPLPGGGMRVRASENSVAKQLGEARRSVQNRV